MSKTISVNKLAEYLATSNAQRRKTIVIDQIKPLTFKVARYDDAKKAMIQAILMGSNSYTAKARTLLGCKKTATSFQESDKLSSIEALKAFDSISFPNSILSLIKIKELPNVGNSISISGLSVNVNPDIIFTTKKKGKTYIGCMKFHISKSHQLGQEGMEYCAIVLHHFLKEKYSIDPNMIVDPSLCFSVDIFAENYSNAPNSYLNKMKAIRAGCEQYILLRDCVEKRKRA